MSQEKALPIPQPDGIRIRELFLEDVPATGVLLMVTVKGSSFVTGQTAMKKAHEVASLVDGLIGTGLPAERITVETIKLQSSSGAILKTSSASYTLKIDCQDLEKMGEILSAVTSAKNISLDSMEWQFSDLDKRKPAWIAAAIEKANARAQDAAKALGVQIAGVGRCQIDYIGLREPAAPRDDADSFGAPMLARRRSFDIGMPMQQTEEKGVRVVVVYHITK